MRSVNRIMIAIVLLACAACKDAPVESKADSAAEKQDVMVELKTDLPPAKHDRTQKPRQKSGEKLLVPQGTKLLSRGAEVTSSDDLPVFGELEMITDGNSGDYENEANYVELMRGLQWVQLDLGKPYALYAILVWHRYSERLNDNYFGGEYATMFPCVYKDVVVQISNDPEFNEKVTTVFNNDNDDSSGFGKGKDSPYAETSEGLWINSKAVKGRYVRLYSNGFIRPLDENSEVLVYTLSELKSGYNQYIEVEVYGK